MKSGVFEMMAAMAAGAAEYPPKHIKALKPIYLKNLLQFISILINFFIVFLI